MAWTTPRTWVAGETVTASLMNTHVRDNLNAIAAVGIDGWTDYSGSATWTGSTNPTYTVVRAEYAQLGKTVIYQFRMTYTSGGTGTWAWSLPVTASAAGNFSVGGGNIYDNNLDDTYLVFFDLASTTTLRALEDARSAGGVVTQTSPFTWASSDVVSGLVIYEAA